MSYRNVTPASTKISSTGSSSKNVKYLLSSSSSSDEEHPFTSTTPCSISLAFPEPIIASHLALTFQGGFSASSVLVWVARAEDSGEGPGLGLMLGGKVFPEDKNKRQIFEIPIPPSGLSPKNEQSSNFEIVTEVPPHANGSKPKTSHNGVDPEDRPHLTELKLEFEKSADQYGRITLYSLEVLA